MLLQVCMMIKFWISYAQVVSTGNTHRHMNTNACVLDRKKNLNKCNEMQNYDSECYGGLLWAFPASFIVEKPAKKMYYFSLKNTQQNSIYLPRPLLYLRNVCLRQKMLCDKSFSAEFYPIAILICTRWQAANHTRWK